jgi:hypothetical protein
MLFHPDTKRFPLTLLWEVLGATSRYHEKHGSKQIKIDEETKRRHEIFSAIIKYRMEG